MVQYVKMLFQPEEKIEEICVQLLGHRPGQNAKEIHEQISFPCTLQSVYKELNKLALQGILVRKKRKYYLQAYWLMKLHSMANDFYARFLDQPQIEAFLPPEKKTYRWKFKSLIETDDFWGHLLVLLLKETDSKVLFEFVSHPWFELIHHHKENLFRETLRNLNKKIYMALGDDSYLTHRCLKHWSSDICTFATAPGPFDPGEGRIVDVMGTYILEVQLPIVLQNQIARLFETTNTSAKIEPGEILEIFRKKSNINVSIRNDAARAKRLRKKFIDYFGLTREMLGEV